MDLRYDVPLYGIREAAHHLAMTPSTLQRWAKRDGLLTTLTPDSPRSARLPFVAMAEAQFYSLLRQSGLTLRAIEDGMAAVRRELGPKMLQRERIAHDGQDILINLGKTEPEWERARDRQGGIQGVIERALVPITWGEDNLPEEVRLVAYGDTNVVINPHFSFGLPSLADSGVRVEDIAHLFNAGDSIATVAREFAVEPEQVESVIRRYAIAA